MIRGEFPLELSIRECIEAEPIFWLFLVCNLLSVLTEFCVLPCVFRLKFGVVLFL